MTSRSSPHSLAFLQKGFPQREFFPHRADLVCKQYADTLLLLERRGMTRPELCSCRFRQINLYSDQLAGLPDELFTDPAINWHSQQLGQKGLIAAAGLCLQDSSISVTVMQSDLCQQLFRHAGLKRACKTQVEKRFGVWYKFLFNAILDFALEAGIAVVYSPTGEWIWSATRKPVAPGLFQRIYNFPGQFYRARRVLRGCAEYWEVPLAENADRVVRLRAASVPAPPPFKPICVVHDTEENLGVDVCPEECRRSLTAMLAIEQAHGVRATYNVVGSLFSGKRDEIRAAGPHCLAFHSYDHILENEDQLQRCRQVDLQVKGYRIPRSRITPEITDYALSYYGFEWLASSRKSFGKTLPALENGIVKIPVWTDDHPVSTGRIDFPGWRRKLVAMAESQPVLVFGLHDCYARFWLDGYGDLLDELAAIGRFVTADELCDSIFRSDG